MDNKEIKSVFQKTKASMRMTMNSDVIQDIDLSVFEDILYNDLAIRLDAYLLARVKGYVNYSMFADRPTFAEWLFRKRRRFDFNIRIEDLKINKGADDVRRTINVESSKQVK